MSNPKRETYVPRQISAGDFPIVMDTGVIAAGQTLHAGAVLGQVSPSMEYVLCKAAAEDGSTYRLTFQAMARCRNEH